MNVASDVLNYARLDQTEEHMRLDRGHALPSGLSLLPHSIMPKKKRPISSACIPQTESRKNATLYDKLTILDWHHKNGGNQSKTARHFKENGFPFISQPRISTWLKDEANLRARANTTRELTSKRVRTVSNPDFENTLIIFVQQAKSRGMALT